MNIECKRGVGKTNRYSKTCLKRTDTCLKRTKYLVPKYQFTGQSLIKITCLKRTKILVPKISALDRFHCMITSNCTNQLEYIHTLRVFHLTRGNASFFMKYSEFIHRQPCKHFQHVSFKVTC